MDIQALQQENVVLKQHTEVLHHCWQEAQKRAETSRLRCQTLIEDISKKDVEIKRLEQRIREYEAHLNPIEEAFHYG